MKVLLYLEVTVDFPLRVTRESVGAATQHHRARENCPTEHRSGTGPATEGRFVGEAHCLKPSTLARNRGHHLCELFYDRRS